MPFSAFDKEKLFFDLKELPSDGQRAFGALCCSRLLPNYLEFQSETRYGDAQPLQKAIELAWSKIEGIAVSAQEVRQLIDSCEAAAPSSEDFQSLRVTSAQDACFAVCCLLDHLIEPDPEKIAQIGAFATDSVDLFIQEVEAMSPADPSLELKILNHDLMQCELGRQISDLTLIKDAVRFESDAKVKLLSLRQGNEKGNLNMN